jgi:hypothetical protein
MWTFDDGTQFEGEKVVRFLTGLRENRITLTAVNKKGKSSSTISYYGYTNVESSMDKAKTRETFIAAFLGQIRCTPLDKDPTEFWTDNMWKCFHDVQELGKGPALLAEVLTKRWEFFKPKMTVEQQENLKKRFFQFVSHYAPEKAEVWLTQGATKSKDLEERRRMKLYLAELYMYHLVDLEKAKEILREVARGRGMGMSAKGSDATIRASIRLGDVAFLERDVNTANKFWGAVQNGVDISEDMLGGKGGPKKTGLTGLAKPKSRAEKEAEAKAKAAAEAKKRKQKGKQEKEFVSAIKDTRGIENWKQAAVVETTVATEVISLMQQGYWDEAYDGLHRWERGFPLSKISGDYLVREAEYYRKTGNIKRAKAIMEAFCDNIDASAFLADAAEKLLAIMIDEKASDKEVREFCEKMKVRFELHPLAKRMEDMINVYGGGNVKREVIKLDF